MVPMPWSMESSTCSSLETPGDRPRLVAFEDGHFVGGKIDDLDARHAPM